MDSTGGTTTEDARVARRSLLKKAAIAGAVAWTTPMIVESVTNPAGALTCAPGNYNVTYATSLVTVAQNNTIRCTHVGTNVTPAAVGMTAAFVGACTPASSPVSGSLGSIAHIASSTGNCQPVRITIGAGCVCTISSVYAHVHMRGGGTCPQSGSGSSATYCWQASTGTNAPLRITAGAIGTTTVTVAPNYQNALICTGSNAAPGIHWGSPAGTGSDPPGATSGYLVVNISCTA